MPFDIDRVSEVAAYIRQYARADRHDLIRAIFDRWPDLSADELDRAINFRPNGRRVLVLPQQPARQERTPWR